MTEAVSPVAPCVAWHCGNKDECNREEGNCCYPSHFYLTTTRMVDPRQIGVKRRLGSVGFETDKEIKSVSASTLSEEYAAKWVELLKEVVPRASLVALLWNPKNIHAARAKEVQDAAKALRVKLESFEVGDPGEFDGTFAAMTRKRVDGLIVIGDPLTVRYRTRIVELAAKNRLSTIYGFAEFVRAGGLMAYGAGVPDMFHRAATFVDKILKGAEGGTSGSCEGGGLAGKRDGDALLLCSVTDLPGCSRGRRGPNPARLRTPDPTGVSGHEGGNSDEYNGRRQRQGVQPMRPDGVTDEPGEEPCDSDGSRDDCNGVQTVAPHLLGRGVGGHARPPLTHCPQYERPNGDREGQVEDDRTQSHTRRSWAVASPLGLAARAAPTPRRPHSIACALNRFCRFLFRSRRAIDRSRPAADGPRPPRESWPGSTAPPAGFSRPRRSDPSRHRARC